MVVNEGKCWWLRQRQKKNNLCSDCCCFVCLSSVNVRIQYFSRHCSAILFIDVKVLGRFAWIGWHRQDYLLLIQVFIYKKKTGKRRRRFHPVPLLFVHSTENISQQPTFNRFERTNMKKKTKNSETRNKWTKNQRTRTTITKHRCCTNSSPGRCVCAIFLHHTRTTSQ